MIRNRESLLRELQQLSFRLYDITLYLDTHPKEKSAIELYNCTLKQYKAMLSNFEKLYGPLTLKHNDECNNEWVWTKGPWPWECQDCEGGCR